MIDSPLAETEPFFLLLGPAEWLSEQLLRGSRGPRPRSAWFSRESFAGLFASGAWADVALLAQPFAGHDHPPPGPAAPAALPAAHVLLACSWCKQELRVAHAAKPPLSEALQLALEFWHAARARLVAVEPVNWAKSGSMLHFCCLVRSRVSCNADGVASFSLADVHGNAEAFPLPHVRLILQWNTSTDLTVLVSLGFPQQ